MPTYAVNERIRRYLLSVTVAIFVTGGLLLVMHSAIQTDEADIVLVRPLPNLQLLPLIPDEEVPVRPPIKEKPKPPPKQPPIVRPTPQIGGTGREVITVPVPLRQKPTIGRNGGLAEGEFLPIMTVPPEYPNRMRTRGIEGWVLVEFSVDKLGRVRAPQVIEARPGSGFNHSALRAVLRYKYKPRVINGEAVRVDGVRQRIVFNMGA